MLNNKLKSVAVSLCLCLATLCLSQSAALSQPRSNQSASVPVIKDYVSFDRGVSLILATNSVAKANRVQYRLLPSKIWKNAKLTKNRVTIQNLKNGATYKISLRLFVKNKWSDESKIIVVVPTNTPLGSPVITSASVASKSIKLNFNLASLAKQPKPTAIQYSIDNGVSWKTSPASPMSGQLNISGLVDSLGYQVKIRVFNAFGASMPSEAFPVVLDAGIAPLNLHAGTSFIGANPFLGTVPIAGIRPSLFSDVKFTVVPKDGAVAKPISATYSKDYLINHQLYSAGSATLDLPVFGLYSDFENTIQITYIEKGIKGHLLEAKLASPKWLDIEGKPMTFASPVMVVERKKAVALDYDYFLLKSFIKDASPIIFDTDGNPRWTSTAGLTSISSIFIDNAIYQGKGSKVTRTELYGVTTEVGDYKDAPYNVVDSAHHNYDKGKYGILIETDTKDDVESTISEITLDGKVLDTWDFAKIIGDELTSCGDNPSDLINKGHDWFHNNSATYWPARDELVVSSREHFVIAVDYSSHKIKWILGDETKYWGQFSCLTKYSLKMSPGSNVPIGQHALSITDDNQLLLFDNGKESLNQGGKPKGTSRSFSTPRSYSIDTDKMVATENWYYTHIDSVSGQEQTVYSPICSSVYKVGQSYLIDYASENYWGTGDLKVRLLGLGANNEVAFEFYIPGFVMYGWNAIPVSIESLKFDH